MPSNFVSVSKAYIEQLKLTYNKVSTIEMLNLYVLTQNEQYKLGYPTPILKNHLHKYLSQYRMIGNNIKISYNF
jgi:hypothetical protein